MATGQETRYIYAGDERIAMIDYQGRTYYYVKDHLGSTRVLLRDDGVTSAKYYRYTAYGECKKEMLSINQANKFTGKPLDGELGLNLYYYGARYYMPNLGRWISVDPLAGKYPGWSPYAYALDNPLRFIDPDGNYVSPVDNPIYRSAYTRNKFAPNQSKYGQTRGSRFHHGVDLKAPVGTTVKAPVTGVASVATGKIGGIMVTVTIPVPYANAGETHTMMHLRSAEVKTGDIVKEGQTVAKSGMTGNAKDLSSDQAHVHYQIKDANGNEIDPATVINIEGPVQEEPKNESEHRANDPRN
jgi:RHS repeat-associated protein